jgi:cytidine deaminase
LREAVEAATRAPHAPYIKCPSGFSVADGDGRIYAGGCRESAAYNPTLGPVQAAIIGMVAAGGGPAGDVVAAALVEKERAEVAQEATVRIFLDVVFNIYAFFILKENKNDSIRKGMVEL